MAMWEGHGMHNHPILKVLAGQLCTYRAGVGDDQVETWRLDNFGEWGLWTRVGALCVHQ